MYGHRTAVWRPADTVRLLARPGGDVTPVRMGRVIAALDMLQPGLVLDGKARARRLAEDLPAHSVQD